MLCPQDFIPIVYQCHPCEYQMKANERTQGHIFIIQPVFMNILNINVHANPLIYL